MPTKITASYLNLFPAFYHSIYLPITAPGKTRWPYKAVLFCRFETIIKRYTSHPEKNAIKPNMADFNKTGNGLATREYPAITIKAGCKK